MVSRAPDLSPVVMTTQRLEFVGGEAVTSRDLDPRQVNLTSEEVITADTRSGTGRGFKSLGGAPHTLHNTTQVRK